MALGCWGSAWNSPLIHYRCRVADCKHFRIARYRRCCHSLPPWCRRAEKLTAANALRALGQVFLLREKAVAATTLLRSESAGGVFFVVGEGVLAFVDELVVHLENFFCREVLVQRAGCLNARHTASNF